MGKSSLLRRFVDDEFGEMVHEGRDYAIKTIELYDKKILLIIFDTYNYNKFPFGYTNALQFRGADGFLLFVMLQIKHHLIILINPCMTLKDMPEIIHL